MNAFEVGRCRIHSNVKLYETVSEWEFPQGEMSDITSHTAISSL